MERLLTYLGWVSGDRGRLEITRHVRVEGIRLDSVGWGRLHSMVARREPTEAVRISEPREDRNPIFYLKSYDFQIITR